jgi:hypothetical protein
VGGGEEGREGIRLLKKSGRVDLNHRPQRPERCALNQAALRPDSAIIVCPMLLVNDSGDSNNAGKQAGGVQRIPLR